MPRLSELNRVAALESRAIVGLMSGTSLDGIDAALCDVAGSGAETTIRMRAFATLPFPAGLRERVEDLLERGTPAELCQLNVRLGEVFADAAQRVVDQAGVSMETIDLIASHGQTIHHVDRFQGGTPSTLQLGEPAVIAERTGRIVVGDFRPRDIAAGGGGAPLVAHLDHCLFARPDRTTALQNIGGIANVTVVTPDVGDVMAFDTGPGNVVIDAVARALTADRERFDRDGKLSAQGAVDPPLLERLLRHEFLARTPPKTTGREVFGRSFSAALLAEWPPDRRADLLATCVRFTAASIARAYRAFVPRAIDEVVVSGGGVHNPTLMTALREELGGVPVRSFDELGLGFTADAKEAVAFALLANETVQGLPSNVPAATGARGPRILGKIVL